MAYAPIKPLPTDFVWFGPSLDIYSISRLAAKGWLKVNPINIKRGGTAASRCHFSCFNSRNAKAFEFWEVGLVSAVLWHQFPAPIGYIRRESWY